MKQLITMQDISKTDIDSLQDSEDRNIILLIIYSENDRTRLSDLLSPLFRVIEAENGVDGFQKCRTTLPDIVVADYQLPAMDAPEMCKSIKENEGTKLTPVIILSDLADPARQLNAYDSGADSYLTYSAGDSVLLSRIRNLLVSRKAILQHRSFDIDDSGDCFAPSSAENNVMNRLDRADRRFLEKLKSLVIENIDNENLEMNLISDKLAMSHSTLYRKVKAITGLSINKYVLRMRFKKAIEMLRNGDSTVVEISEATGFSTPTYFRKAFKREFGITPSEYAHRQPNP